MTPTTPDHDHDRLAACAVCGRLVPLHAAGLVEDGAVLCPGCARHDVEVAPDPPAPR